MKWIQKKIKKKIKSMKTISMEQLTGLYLLPLLKRLLVITKTIYNGKYVLMLTFDQPSTNVMDKTSARSFNIKT